MDVLVKSSVRLPDGQEVMVSRVPEAWYTTNNASGYINPKALAGDSRQPRQHLDETRLQELFASVTQVGVREAITVTPTHLCDWLTSDQGGKFFLIVSGHRRWRAALQANLMAVPIRVVIYKTEADHRLDGSLLNRNRDDLSPLEVGLELVGLRKLGWTIDQLSKAYGMSAPIIYIRTNLTKLDPEILKQIDPALPYKKRLSITIAGALGGLECPSVQQLSAVIENFSQYCEMPNLSEDMTEQERRYTLQRAFLAVIQKRKLNSARALEFMRVQKLQLSNGTNKGRLHEPRIRRDSDRDIILNWLRSIRESVVMDKPPKEIARAFEYTPREEIERILEQLGDAEDLIRGLKRIIAMIRDTKKPTHPLAIKALRKH